MRELFLDIPAQYEGCSGSRNLSDNISDLKAQIAANSRGISLIQNLIQEYGLKTVQMYMYEIQRTAELAVRNLLKEMYRIIVMVDSHWKPWTLWTMEHLSS